MVSLATINENLPVKVRVKPGQRSDLPTLRHPVTPDDGQSLRGLTARSLRRNGIRTAWRVLEGVGAPARNRLLLCEHPNVSAERLSTALQVDEDIVRARMYPLIDTGERSFFGLPVPQTGIENRERRFAPKFFEDNRHHLAAWELRLLPFCPVTWDILVSQCPCRPGKVTTQGWTRTGSYPDQCDECGRPLSRVKTGNVPVERRERLELAARMVLDATHGCDDWRKCLPEHLRGVDAGSLFRVLHTLADNIRVPERTGPEPDLDLIIPAIDARVGAAISRLAEACTTLMEWPYAIEDAKFDLAENSAVLVKLQKDYCALGVVREGKEPADGKGIGGAVHHPLLDDSKPIGIREATAVARLSVATLEAIWNTDLVTRYVRPHGGRVLPAFDATELENMADQWRERLELGSVAYRLGIARYGLEQLIDQGVVQTEAITATGLAPAFLEQNVSKFEADLTAKANDEMTDGVSISQALRKVSGRAKPWGRFVAAMLDGTVRYGVLEGNSPILERVVLSVNFDATKLLTRNSDDGNHQQQTSSRLCQSDALEILNCSASSLSILDGVASEGKNPKTFDRGSVLELAARIVATAEVAEHLCVHPARVVRIMRSANIHEEVRGGWPRERTMRFVARVRELQASQMQIAFESQRLLE